MAFEFGFYNSINGDRKYNAIQMSQIFDGVIMDGVFASIGDKLFTTANGGMEIAVGTGKAWFNHTWNLNTTKMVFTLTHSHAVLQRYDAVVLEVNDEQSVYGRVNAIKVIEGTPSSNAIKPTMIKTQYVHQYPLAYVKVNAAVEAITAADIEIVVGTTPCPFVTSVLQQTDITGLFANWNQQFTTWFNNLKAQLTDNVVTNLQNQINNCLKPTDIATAAQIKAGTAGKVVDAAGLKSNAENMVHKVGDIIYTLGNKGVDTRWQKANGRLLYPSDYPEFRPISWRIRDYVNRGDNINSNLNAYGVHQDVQLIFAAIILNAIMIRNNEIAMDVFDRINTAYTQHRFTASGMYPTTCSGMGSCARYQDGKVMFVFWTQSGLWYVLECAANADIWNSDKWVLFSTSSAVTSVPRANIDTMYRHGNTLFCYEQGGHVIKIDLEYTYKSLIVADAGLVTQNLGLTSNVTMTRCVAECIIFNGAYLLPVVMSTNVVGLINIAASTGLGVSYTFSSTVFAGRDYVRCFIRNLTSTNLQVDFLSTSGVGISASTKLSGYEIALNGTTGNLIWSVKYDDSFAVTDIPSTRGRQVAIAAHGVGGFGSGMTLACHPDNPAMMMVYSDFYNDKLFYEVHSIHKDRWIAENNIAWRSYPLDFPIIWPVYQYYQDSYDMYSQRPYNTIWLYGEIWNDWAMAMPYAIKEEVPGRNGSTTNVGTRITYIPNYRLPRHDVDAERDLGSMAWVKVQS